MSIGEGPDVGRTCPLWAYHLVGWPWSMQDRRQLPGGSKQAHKDPWSLCSWMWLSCDLLPEFLPWFPLSHKPSPGIVNQMPSPHIAFFFFLWCLWIHRLCVCFCRAGALKDQARVFQPLSLEWATCGNQALVLWESIPALCNRYDLVWYFVFIFATAIKY